MIALLKKAYRLMPTNSRFRPLALYLLLVFAISSIGYARVIVSGHVGLLALQAPRQCSWPS